MIQYVLNDDKMFSDIADGIAIVINSETGIYYGMNPFGTIVYENLMNGVPAEEIISEIKRIPGATAEIEEVVNTFIQRLVEFEIIMRGEPEAGKVEIDHVVAQTGEFKPTVDEFNDAQEMLLADPIHEVKKETGWEPDTSVREDRNQ